MMSSILVRPLPISRGAALTMTVLVVIVAGATPASANEHCRIDRPSIVTGAGGAELRGALTCAATASPGTVRYPAGNLILGSTLFQVSNPRARNAVVPIQTSSVNEFRDIRPIEIPRPAASAPFAIPLGTLPPHTHVLLAVWDKKTECNADFGNPECKLGEVDAFEMPTPIDAWPRPVCDIGRLTSSGFFRWVDQDGDPGGLAVPDRHASAMQANDCWSRSPNRPGLGYSVRRWRVQPLQQ